MREILFRGKRTDNGEWAYGTYGSYISQYGTTMIYLDHCEGEYGFYAYYVDPETVGQFIGLTDKNGKKIFEGDIVCRTGAENRPDEYAVVRYGEFNCSCCNGVYGWFFEGIKYDFADIRCPEWHIIIGNIHDNPELVEVKSER